ncbi:DUF3564 family protein [Caballeronia sp. AZ1_KS37]|uniref:DUF3564 family protein n=1 Tax=Caballeronia sp. AZ1_KS37 TaxID=2921756 RepID=UPI0020295572|nr:DUF3564 family protein [Caballeronia sp. AZ1_KS37]
MRVTLHLDGKTPDGPCPYAVIWLDAATRTWQREGYVGIDLPESGKLTTDGIHALVCGSNNMAALCVLEAFDLERPRRGANGIAQWYGTPSVTAQSGRWLVEHVEAGEASVNAQRRKRQTIDE